MKISDLNYAAARAVASGLGSGYSPVSPGTVGSLACILFWYILNISGIILSRADGVAAAVVCILIGTLAAHICVTKMPVDDESRPWQQEKQKIDPQFIVIDEWAGMLITLAGVPHGSINLVAAAFILFRIFDILKPVPVSLGEKLPGAWGVMADDIIAGLISALLLNAALMIFLMPLGRGFTPF